MKFLNLVAIFTFYLIIPAHSQKDPVDYVNPMIGTHDSRPMQFPGAAMPFGMVKLSPDNQKEGWKAGHDYKIKNIAGFNFLHDYHMTGFYVLPVTGKIQTKPGPEDNPDLGYRSRISNDKEYATPGYYSVILDDYDIKAELSSTVRTGVQRYTFPKSDDAAIMYDFDIPYEDSGEVLEAVVTKVSDTELQGYIKMFDDQRMGQTIWLENDYILYFVTRFDKSFNSLGAWQDENITENINEFRGKGDVGCFVRFKTKAGEEINVLTGISTVSLDQARLNLDTETAEFGFEFDKYIKEARKVWNELLGKIRIKGGSETDRIKFYTNLYRTYCTRTIWSDVNGKWTDMNEEIAQAPDADPVYGCDAFWGMKWNLNGLWSLVNPSLMNTWVKSLLEIYKRGGWLPKGPTAGEYTAIMTSSPAVSLIVAAYQQGIREYDVELAYEACKKIMMEPGGIHKSGGFAGNRWLKQYMDYQYIPFEEGPASATMEMAFQDWCVAQMAKDLGKEDDYKYFMDRSLYYRNHFDSKVKYARIKSSAGTWVEPFTPFTSRGFIEGNPWQYTFYAPHDVQGIINFLGQDEFLKRLNRGFENSRESKFNATGDQYAKYPINHGNQPNMQAAFLFNYGGEPWHTQKWTREILDIYYGATPTHGWPGDEDEGQMGAWFVMSSLGLFQMQGGCSVNPIFDLGSPLFDEAEVSLENGKKIRIMAINNSKVNVYVQSAKLNGKKLDKSWIYCSDIQHGGKLEFVMGPEPNKSWGLGEMPPSISKPGKWDDDQLIFTISADKMVDEDRKTFLEPIIVKIEANQKPGTIRYTQDGNLPDMNSTEYSGEFTISNTTTITAAIFDKTGKQISPIRKAKYTKIDYENNLTTGQEVSCSGNSRGHGPEHGVDGIVDLDKFWDSSPYPQWWQVKLDEVHEISKVHLFTYWDNWRYYQYTIDISIDGENWTTVVDASSNETLASKEGYRHEFEAVKAQFIRVNFLKNSANPGTHVVEFRVY